jgi:hypothetical protein
MGSQNNIMAAVAAMFYRCGFVIPTKMSHTIIVPIAMTVIGPSQSNHAIRRPNNSRRNSIISG